MNTRELEAFASKIRRATYDMVLYRGDGHIGGVLSMSGVSAALFGNYAKEGDWSVLFKGHVGPAYYATLMLTGKPDQKHIHILNENGTLLPSHSGCMKAPGVQVMTGPLGQEISQAAGIAYASKTMKREGDVFCMVEDGECNEGEVFEASQFIANKRLSNCIVMVDCNKRQVDGLLREVSCDFDFPALLQSIGFHVCEVDRNAAEAVNGKSPKCIKRKEQASAFLLSTVKGVGIPYFEQQGNPHHVTFNEADKQVLQDYTNLTGKELNT